MGDQYESGPEENQMVLLSEVALPLEIGVPMKDESAKPTGSAVRVSAAPR